MKCDDAIKNMDRFVKHKMSTKEMAAFLAHIDSCPSCYEELETYYTVAVALHYLEKNEGEGYNIPLRLQHTLEEARKKVRREERYYRVLQVLVILLTATLLILMVTAQAPQWTTEFEDLIWRFTHFTIG
jgi:hypothetical protein